MVPGVAGRERIPVTLLTGFLGSGKTTLANRLLRRASFANTAVIVNELGEIGLDHLLVERGEDSVLLLDSGCLCCALQGGLRETLADLFVRRAAGSVPRFERVVVETTGVADPGPIANALVLDALLRAEFRLAAIVTTVDAMHAMRQLGEEPEAVRQVVLADVLIVTKTDLATHNAVAALGMRLEELNPTARKATALRGDLDPDLLFPERRTAAAVPAAGERLWHSGRGAPAAGVRERRFTTFERRFDHPVHWSGIAAWTALVSERYGERLLRVKGLLAVGEERAPVAIHAIGGFFHPPERLDRWPSADRTSRLVCIGRDLDETTLERSLRALALEEGAQRPLSLADL
jgi:G3E family GTPase